VLSFPFKLRFLFASYPEIMGKILGIVNKVLSSHLINKAGFSLHADVAAECYERGKTKKLPVDGCSDN